MYSSRYSIGGLRTVSHESPSYSQETRSISRQFSSQDDTPRVLPRRTPHHTRSFSNSYSFDRSNDASFNDRSSGSHNIARRMSESISRDNLKDMTRGNISHGRTCDICTDNTPCDICNQNAKAVDQNAGIDISGGYSRSFPSYSLWADASHRTSDDVSHDVNSHDANCKICSDSASESSRHAAHDVSKKTSNEGFRGFSQRENDAWNRNSLGRRSLSYDLSQILIGDDFHDHLHESGKGSSNLAGHSHNTGRSTSHQVSKSDFDDARHAHENRSDGSHSSSSVYSQNATHNHGSGHHHFSHDPPHNHSGGRGIFHDSSHQHTTGRDITQDTSHKHQASRDVPDHRSHEHSDGRGDSHNTSHKLFLDNISERSHNIGRDESFGQHNISRSNNRKVAFDTSEDDHGTCYHGYNDLNNTSRGISRSEQTHDKGRHDSSRHETTGHGRSHGTVNTGLSRNTSSSSDNRSRTEHSHHVSDNPPSHHTHVHHDTNNHNQNNRSSEHNTGGSRLHGHTVLLNDGSRTKHSHNTTRDDRSEHSDSSSNSSRSHHHGHHHKGGGGHSTSTGIYKNRSSSEHSHGDDDYHNTDLNKSHGHTKKTDKTTTSTQNQQTGGSSRMIYLDGHTSDRYENGDEWEHNLKAGRSDRAGHDHKTDRSHKTGHSNKAEHNTTTKHSTTTERNHNKGGYHNTERDGSSGQTRTSTGISGRTSGEFHGHGGFVEGDSSSETHVSHKPNRSGSNDGGGHNGHHSHTVVIDSTPRSGQPVVPGGGLSSHPHTHHTPGQEPSLPGTSSRGPPPRPPRELPPQGLPPQGLPPQVPPVQGLPPRGLPPQGPAQGLPPQGLTPQGPPVQGLPPQGPPVQGLPPQGPPFQELPPQQQPAFPGPSTQVPRLQTEKNPFVDPSRSNSSNGHFDEPPSEHPRVPKPITRHGWRRYVHFSGWLIHIPAIILTAILLWFTSRERFWYRLEGPSRVNLTPKGVEVLLLVLLKIWEILVILSLSAMAIGMIRRRLIGGGVRLGFLTGGYRVGDFRYLFSLPFWRHGMFSLAFWEIMMAFFFIFATLITIILLPAAGALLLPSLQWFSMDHTRAFGNVSTPLLYQTQATQVWPTLFTDSAPWNNTRGCTEVEGIYNAACPAGGFTEIWNWAGGFATTGLSNQVTFSDSSTNLRRQLLITEITDSSVQDPPILSTTPSHHLNINFGLVKNYIDNGNGNNNGGDMNGDYPYRLSTRRIDSGDPSNLQASNPIFQPFVQSKCYVAPKAEILANNGSLNYPVSSLNCFGDTACLQAQRASPPRAINASQWDTPECQGQLITTNVFVYQNGTPILQIAGQLPDPGGDHTQDRLFACNFLASWVAASISTDSSECDALVSGLNNPDTMLSTFQKQSFGAPTEGYVMKFDSSWFQYLSPVSFASSVMVNGSKALKYYSATESFVRHFAVAEESRNGTATTRYSAVNNSTIGLTQAETFLSKVFGVYLTDAISRTGSESSTLVRSGSAAQVVVGVNAQYSKDDGPLVNETSDSAAETSDPATESPILARQVPEGTISDSMGFDFNVERYGWGTGKASRELDFGKAVLYIYFAVLILYLLTVLFGIVLELFGRWPSMHVLSVVPWWDLQELFVLALKTSPPRDGDLADAGAGVTSCHVWKKRVRAMADAHHNVELVLNDGTVREELSKTGKQKYF